MTIVVDPQFSAYRLIERTRQASIMIRQRREMIKLSYKIEEHLLNEEVKGVLFSSFQYLSRFMNRRHVYEQIAQRIQHVYVFAYPDIPIPDIPNLTIVPISETDALIHEWFVIFHGVDYFSGIVARELRGADGTREFSSLWTFDLDIIRIITDWLMSLLDVRVALLPDQQYDVQHQAALMDEDVDYYLDIADEDEDTV